MKTKLFILFVLIAHVSFGQESKYKNELINLANIYHNFQGSSELTSEVTNQLNSISTPNLFGAKKFISEFIKTDNQLLTKEHLSKPDSITLKNLFIIRGINWNMYEANPTDNILVIDSMLGENTEYYEHLSCYYDMLFGKVGNNYRSFDMSKINFTMSDYNLQNDVEKGIFFLESHENPALLRKIFKGE
ncbi:MAG: hypothetical protein HYZ42_09290 [Bacteroidetes bacterium]|nr:hypothetical protein [Bacteroidota bacterium]